MMLGMRRGEKKRRIRSWKVRYDIRREEDGEFSPMRPDETIG